MADDEQEQKPDLRYTSREDRGVTLNRDLSGGGHLARGSSTRMSSLRFSVQAKPRDEMDPELQALHDTPPVKPSAPPAPPPVMATDASTGAPDAPVAPHDEASPEQNRGDEAAPGFLAAVKRLFS